MTARRLAGLLAGVAAVASFALASVPAHAETCVTYRTYRVCLPPTDS
jgi:hypothetical protein